ncbi:MAG TPA: MYG1 family protein [Candidatus Caccousia avistercoris]|nr:MYG1 family protein [Candidatus Caccousia avistercoris]
MEPRQIPSRAVTHAGKFHADDVFSSALLRLLQPGLEISRVYQVPEGFDGLAFDVGWGEFDHHQKGAPLRENGVPYAAFGLLWRAFGAQFLEQGCSPEDAAREAARFDEEFVQPLDLDDNTGCGHPLASVIGCFNPAWDSDRPADQCFWEAVAFASTVLQKRAEDIWAVNRASDLVRKALSRMKDGIVVLEKYCPWKMILKPSPALFVVYPSQRGGYGAQVVPDKETGEPLVDFPAAWAGKPAEELQRLTGIPTLRFCHNGRFLVTADTQEDAVAACRLARQAGEKK